MRTLLLCAMLVGTPLVAFAQDNESQEDTILAEVWLCREFGASYDNRERFRIPPPVLVKLWRQIDVESVRSGYGRLRVGKAPGVDYFFATYTLDGLNKRWNWGFDERGGADYSFLIEPDGTGSFYDFRGVEPGEGVKPRDLYSCTRDGTMNLTAEQRLDWAVWYAKDALVKQSEKEK